MIDPYLCKRPKPINDGNLYSPVWNCPTNPDVPITEGAASAAYPEYTANRSLFALDPLPKLASLRSPAKKVLLLEFGAKAEHDLAGGTVTSVWYFQLPPSGPAPWRGFFGHNRGMNLLFGDYHAEWLPVTHLVFRGTAEASAAHFELSTD